MDTTEEPLPRFAPHHGFQAAGNAIGETIRSIHLCITIQVLMFWFSDARGSLLCVVHDLCWPDSA